MGLELSISLDKDIREIDQFLTDLKFKAVTMAARQGLNRSAQRVRTVSTTEIRKRRNLKLSDARKRVTTTKAKGSDIAKLEARVNFSGIPLPMILFIVGSKEPKIQKLPNPRRKSRKFQIKKGTKQAKKGLFVQKAKRGQRAYQVFRRTDPSDKTQGFKKQSVPSIAAFLRSKMNILRRIENKAIAIMQVEYDRALTNQLRKLKL